MVSIFFDIGLFLGAATLLGFLFVLARQPPIPAYILGGVLLGLAANQFGLNLDAQMVSVLSEMGIAFLLFGVGLEMNFHKLRSVGKVATLGGSIQLLALFSIGTWAASLLAFTKMESIYIGLFLAFSSTMVVVKLLSDRSELDTLHGRIMVGMLLLQDIVALFAISLLQNADNISFVPLLISFGSALLVVAIGLLLGAYVFPAIFKGAARSQEILFLSALTVCFAFAILFSAIGFSIVIGAFVAGLALGNLPYRTAIHGRIQPLRDFFGTLFFATIGYQLVGASLGSLLVPLLVLLAVVTLVLPIVYLIVCHTFGYKRRTALLVAMGMAQSSEFGLVLAMQGKSLGHIGPEIFSLLILVAIITMTSTAYTLKYGDQIYRFLLPFLKVLHRIGMEEKLMGETPGKAKHDIILIGHDRLGYSIRESLERMKQNFVIVDFNPDVVSRLHKKGLPCMYGDIADPEFLSQINIESAKMVISTIPDIDATKFLVKQVKAINSHLPIIVTSLRVESALELYASGADYVVVPHYLGGEHMSLLLEEVGDNIEKLITTRIQHIQDLQKRQHTGSHSK